MKKSKIIILIVIVVVVGYLYFRPKADNKKLEFTYTTLKTGDIETVISSTGTLEAINTVEVGTQISGTISHIYVDYNDEVEAGQLLAEMDLSYLNTNLMTAKANLAVSDVSLRQMAEEFQRSKKLHEKGIISEQLYTNAKYAYEQAQSAKKVSEASLKGIEVNMSYAHITSPINGIITERSVEEGQTVAASFTTPRMFVIAEDLSKMQILADVDESDIGYIENNMPVHFSVQTYPEKTFYGEVKQIRIQAIKVNNVVNYQVVIGVDNADGLLLPGMTTNLDFITETAEEVLLVNNSALRFRPNEAMLKEIKPTLEAKASNITDDIIKQKFLNALNDEDNYTPAHFKDKLPAAINGFFYQDKAGKIDFKFIEVGVSSGLESEVKQFLDKQPFKAGDKVINSLKTSK